MHLIMAPIVISGLVAKLKARKLRRQLDHPSNKTPELTLFVESIQRNIQQSSGGYQVEQDKVQAGSSFS